jgi:excisionase family DNA binding protein
MASNNDMAAKVLNVHDLAVLLRVHQSTIYRLLKAHQLPAFRMGSHWRFNREHIDQWRLGQTAAVESKN